MLHDFSTLHAALPWFFPLAAFVFGTCVGSFLNVVIHRQPRKESVVTPGSHCGCGQPIRWFDNVPVLSWFLLRGRARCCGRPFSFRYPAVELLTGLLFAACALRQPGEQLNAQRCQWNWPTGRFLAEGNVVLRRSTNQQLTRASQLRGTIGNDGTAVFTAPGGRVNSQFTLPQQQKGQAKPARSTPAVRF